MIKQNMCNDLESLRTTLKSKLPELQTRYGIKSLGIFGSFVHGLQKKRSDVDLLVEFEEMTPVSLIGFIALERELSKLVGHKVDLVEKDTLKPVIGKRILDEVIQL